MFPTTPKSLGEDIYNSWYDIPHSAGGAAYLRQNDYKTNRSNGTPGAKDLPFGDMVLYKDQAKKLNSCIRN